MSREGMSQEERLARLEAAVEQLRASVAALNLKLSGIAILAIGAAETIRYLLER